MNTNNMEKINTKSLLHRSDDKKEIYLQPGATIVRIQASHCLMQSNGENLYMSTFGSRGDAEDSTDGFWD